MIGDGGELNEASKQNLASLQKEMQDAGAASATLFLGDNIYPSGMPEEGHKDRAQAEEVLSAQLDLVKNYPGKAIMIPGNHDWNEGHKDGWESVLRAQDFIEDYISDRQVLYPENGCPGPESFELTEDILLILYDSQWILHGSDRPGENESCPAKTGREIFAQVQELVRINEHKKIILAAHHPIRTYGVHGGRSNFRHHVFPLTEASKNLYIPLPIIGSAYPLYRKYY